QRVADSAAFSGAAAEPRRPGGRAVVAAAPPRPPHAPHRNPVAPRPPARSNRAAMIPTSVALKVLVALLDQEAGRLELLNRREGANPGRIDSIARLRLAVRDLS